MDSSAGGAATPPPFVLTGLPRGGTTFLAAVLYRPPRVVTVSEGRGRWKKLHRAGAGANEIAAAFADVRRALEVGEPIHTFEGTPGFRGEGRVDTWNQPKHLQSVAVAPGFALGLKNPEVFLAWLPAFRDLGYRTVISVRHPVSVLSSWVKKGQSDAGVVPDSFANGVAATYRASAPDVVDRRIEFYEHLAAQVVAASGPDVLVIRHEDWSGGPGQLARVTEFLGIEDPGELRPPVLPADAPQLSRDEQARVIEGCVTAGTWGYGAL